MQIVLSGANIVVLAENHNPAIASKEWLRSKGIFDEEALNFVHTPVLSIFESEGFHLIVEPNRLQIAIKAPNEIAISKLQKATNKYIQALPETPYRAVGLNFIWATRAEAGKDPSQILKGLFISDAERTAKALGVEEFQAGGILGFQVESFVVRLVIERTTPPPDIICNFNYHSDVPGYDEAQRVIGMFQAKYEDSKQIVSRLFGSV